MKEYKLTVEFHNGARYCYYGKTWNGIMLRTQPLFCCYGQIGYQVFVYDRERHAATFTYDWERQQIKFSNN